MAKFLFMETATVELMVKNGRASGGAAVQTLVWMEGLHLAGHEVYVSIFEDDDREILEEFRKFKFLKIYNSRSGIKWLRWVSHRFSGIYMGIRKIRPDYLYESVPFWGSFVLNMICKLFKVKHVIRISNDRHLDERFRIVASKMNQRMLFKGLKSCDLILTQNDFQYQKLKEFFPKKRIFKIHNPIRIPDGYLSIKSELKGHISWIANFRFQKNLKLLFEIAEIMPDESFKIAGVPSHPFDEESKIYIEKLRQMENVEFLGKVERADILPLLVESKFLLNTSRFEGFSNTFLEAMITGTPILTTRNVDPDGLVEKNQLGIIYLDNKDLKQKIVKMTQNEYFEMSKNCVDYVAKNHEYKRQTQILMSHLSELGK